MPVEDVKRRISSDTFISAICKALDIPSDHVRRITIDAEFGDLVMIHVYHVADARILPAVATAIVSDNVKE